MRISDWSSDVCSSDLRGTGAGATGLGDAGATFPDPHADGLRIEDLGEFDVDALREQRVMLDLRTDLADRHGLGVGYEEHHMGIADIDGTGAADAGEGVIHGDGFELAGARDAAPGEARAAHVAGDHAAGAGAR